MASDIIREKKTLDAYRSDTIAVKVFSLWLFWWQMHPSAENLLSDAFQIIYFLAGKI